MSGSLGSAILPMANPIRDYDWGAIETLARLQGRPPSGAPEAELWMGAHPSAPSMVADAGGTVHRLDELVARRPHDLLGADVVAVHGARLPYLLKVLAIASPLSLQVHPDRDRARDGFAGEVAVLGEHRYVDPFPKPEMLYALEPVEALCGFRPAARPRACSTGSTDLGWRRSPSRCATPTRPTTPRPSSGPSRSS
jgi:mannose-6-phosphate isomerase